MSCRVVSCRVVSCRVVSCRVVSCRVVSCHVMSCHVMMEGEGKLLLNVYTIIVSDLINRLFITPVGRGRQLLCPELAEQ